MVKLWSIFTLRAKICWPLNCNSIFFDKYWISTRLDAEQTCMVWSLQRIDFLCWWFHIDHEDLTAWMRYKQPEDLWKGDMQFLLHWTRCPWSYPSIGKPVYSGTVIREKCHCLPSKIRQKLMTFIFLLTSLQVFTAVF